MFRLTWSTVPVADQIAALANADTRRQCYAAYTFLMSERRSAYKPFIDQCELSIAANERFNVFDIQQSRYVECCLRPNLHPSCEWCDSSVDGSQSRASTKVSFLTKVNSCIADYSLV